MKQRPPLRVEWPKDISVLFRGKEVGDFKADLIVDQKVILELKAVSTFNPAHEAQLINYLKARPPRLSSRWRAGNKY